MFERCIEPPLSEACATAVVDDRSESSFLGWEVARQVLWNKEAANSLGDVAVSI